MMRSLPDKSRIRSAVHRLAKVFHVHSTFATALPNLLSIPVALFCLPYLLVRVDPALFGTMILITLIINQSQVILFGIDKSASYLISKSIERTETVRDVYSTTFMVATLLAGSIAVLHTAVLLSGVIEFSRVQSSSILLISAGIFCHLIWSVQRAYLIAAERFSVLGVLNFLHLSSALVVPVMVIAIFNLSDSISVLLIPYFLFRLLLLVAFSGLLPSLKFLPRAILKKKIKDLLEQGKWMGTSNLISQIFEGMERYFLSFLGPISLVPSYHIPLQLSQKLAVFPQALSTVLFSRLSKGESLNRELLTLISVLLIPISGLFMILNEPVLLVWLGSALQAEMISISAITFIAMAFASMNFIISGTAEATGLSEKAAKIDLAMVLPAIVLSFYLIYFFNITGAAFALLLRELTFFVIRLKLISGAFNSKQNVVISALILLLLLFLEISTPIL